MQEKREILQLTFYNPEVWLLPQLTVVDFVIKGPEVRLHKGLPYELFQLDCSA